MAISAQRFKFLDQETDVGILDFQNPLSSDIFNSPNNQLDEIDADMAEFIEQNLASAEIPGQSIVDEAVRQAKDLASSLQDLSGLSTKQLDALASKMFPGNPMQQSAYGQLARSCVNRGAGYGGFGRPFNPSVNCNGLQRSVGSGSGGCSANSISNLLNKLTGGAYNSLYNDANGLLASIMALAGLGFNANMCGVFGALTNGVPFGVSNRAAAGLINMLSKTGNINGIIDIGKEVGIQMLYPSLESPGLINSTMAGFELPDDLSENDYSMFTDSFTESISQIDENWATSSYDGIISSQCISDYNTDMNAIYDSKLMDNIYSEDELDMIPQDDFDYFAVASECSDSGFVGEFI